VIDPDAYFGGVRRKDSSLSGQHSLNSKGESGSLVRCFGQHTIILELKFRRSSSHALCYVQLQCHEHVTSSECFAAYLTYLKSTPYEDEERSTIKIIESTVDGEVLNESPHSLMGPIHFIYTETQIN
jgi:hypothetical protein